MQCVRCKLEWDENAVGEIRYCLACGWELGKDLPKPPEPEKPPDPACRYCEKTFPQLDWRLSAQLNICPYCGKYLGFNADELHPLLIQIALLWTGPVYDFCDQVLKVPKRISRSMKYCTSAIDVLAFGLEDTGRLRHFAGKSYKILDDARNEWEDEDDTFPDLDADYHLLNE